MSNQLFCEKLQSTKSISLDLFHWHHSMRSNILFMKNFLERMYVIIESNAQFHLILSLSLDLSLFIIFMIEYSGGNDINDES